MLRFAAFSVLLLLVDPGFAQTFTDRSDLLPSGSSGIFEGAALMDVDGDGRTDLSGPSRLLLRREMGFEARPISGDSPLGSIFGDIDRDGHSEALVLYAFEPNLRTYHHAREIYLPIPGGGIDVGSGFVLVQGSLLLDYDNDGNLDVFIGHDGGMDMLFRGLGDGTFVNASYLLPTDFQTDYGAHAADFDRDGDVDIYVGICPANENLLYRNDGVGGFSEVAASVGLADVRSSWGVTWFDFDNDGWLDVFVANHSGGSDGLFRNQGNGTFVDVAATAGIAGPTNEDTWAATTADFDNDGWIDVFVANNPQASRFYHNNGNGTFLDMTTSVGLGGLSYYTPVTTGDVNGDGWNDLYMSGQSSAPDALFFNDGGSNSWLKIRLRGQASNPDGIGARVEASAGSLQMVREISAGDGMGSQSHGLVAHFGLGEATTANITVRWPSGQVDLVNDIAANQDLTLVEGVGLNGSPSSFALLTPGDGSVIIDNESIPLTWEAAIDPEGDLVNYSVLLFGPNGDQTYEVTEPMLTLPHSFGDRGAYSWVVIARDDYSPRTALDPFHFTGGSVANEDQLPGQTLLTMDLWPNPARRVANVRYELPIQQEVTVRILDALGRAIRTIDHGLQPQGNHSLTVGLDGLDSGLYLVRISGERSGSISRRLVKVE